MTSDREPLDERQWLRLLAGTPVGRIVYTLGALPAVLPVRYHLDGAGSVLVRAAAASELVRAVSGARNCGIGDRVSSPPTGASCSTNGVILADHRGTSQGQE